MTQNKLVPVLVLEDCELTNMIISEFGLDTPNLELVITTTKEQALETLNSRNNFLVAFIDRHLENGTSEGVIKAIQETQKGIIDIYATSSDGDKRKIQVTREGATRECEKYDIVSELTRIHNSIQ